MEIHARSGWYLLSIAIMNAAVCAIFVAGIVIVGFAEFTNAFISGILAVGALYLMRGAWIFGLAYGRRPGFRIDIAPRTLSIAMSGHQLRIDASDVVAYYIYNNKIVLHVPALAGQPGLLPFVRVHGENVVVYLYLTHVGDLVQGFRVFDDSFEGKRRVNLGMIAQAIGMGIS
jgi:hypothetical protein